MIEAAAEPTHDSSSDPHDRQETSATHESCQRVKPLTVATP